MMSSVEYFREFINQRLSAAAEEIFGAFAKTIIEYEEKIDRQRGLLDIAFKPVIQLQRIEPPQQHVCKEEEVLSDQQLCIQERNSSLDQEDPDPPQIKEEQEQLCTSQEGEQLELKQETEAFMLTPSYEESNHTEPEPTRDHQLLSNNSHVAESQDQKGSEHEDSESTSDSEPKKRHHESRSHCNDINNLSKTCSDPQTGKALFQCDTCGEAFKFRSHFYKHLRTHSGEKSHSCSFCEKSFSKISSLKAHIKIHTADKPHSCKTCGKDFQYISQLMLHIRTHTGEKPYSCQTCGKDFGQSSHLMVHMRTHTGEKPYSCKTCGKEFRLREYMLVHMRRAHTGEEPYLCKTCGKTYCDCHQLAKHKRLHTDK